ncbi:hypothetical protein [Halovulum sp. GXIMD14793]
MRNAVEDMYAFIDHMKSRGWVNGKHQYELLKGDWIILFDTSSWIEVGTRTEPRVFDVPVPAKNLMQWTENLISHLCKTSDALNTGCEIQSSRTS